MYNEKRILAIDYGKKRIGLAVTDPLNIFASPLITLENNNSFMDKFKQIIVEYNVATIILGDPLKENGQNSDLDSQIRKFKKQIEEKFQIDVHMIDERYSSQIAQQRIIQSIKSKKKRRDKSLLDKNAAAVILEDYLKQIAE